MRMKQADIVVLELSTYNELDRAAFSAEIYHNMVDKLKGDLDQAKAEIERLNGENEALQRGLKESENNVEYWRSSYSRAIKKYTEVLKDEDHE